VVNKRTCEKKDEGPPVDNMFNEERNHVGQKKDHLYGGVKRNSGLIQQREVKGHKSEKLEKKGRAENQKRKTKIQQDQETLLEKPRVTLKEGQGHGKKKRGKGGKLDSKGGGKNKENGKRKKKNNLRPPFVSEKTASSDPDVTKKLVEGGKEEK